MKMPESGRTYETPAWRVRRIAEIQAELFNLQQIVASNEHIVSPDGEDLGGYADDVTAAISELKAELDELQTPSEDASPKENISEQLSKEELEQHIKDLRAKILFLSIQSDTEEARTAQAELEEAEQILKTL